MAGRGVDIKLGEGVRELGGLYVLGTERHEARRIDNQLRGRSGRQGDPGETRFYLSAQDDLVRLFAGDRIHGIMNRFKIPEDQPMEAGILSKQIENAQKKVEEQNFVARKNVLKYDDVMNTQRMVIYEQRRRVLEGEDLSEEVKEWIRETVEAGVAQFTDSEFAEDWDLEGLVAHMQSLYGTDITVDELRDEIDVASREALTEEFVEDALETYEEREQALGPEIARDVERFVILQVVDRRWREHLETMDYLREGVHLRAFAQKDPLVEYRGEGHIMFEQLSDDDPLRRSCSRSSTSPSRSRSRRSRPRGRAAGAFRTSTRPPRAPTRSPPRAQRPRSPTPPEPPRRSRRRSQAVNEHKDVGRNDPCWCGSGKKYKRCHGAEPPQPRPAGGLPPGGARLRPPRAAACTRLSGSASRPIASGRATQRPAGRGSAAPEHLNSPAPDAPPCGVRSGGRAEVDLELAVERVRDAKEGVDPRRPPARLEARDRRLRRAGELRELLLREPELLPARGHLVRDLREEPAAVADVREARAKPFDRRVACPLAHLAPAI